MKTSTKVQIATVVTGILVGAAEGAAVAWGLNDHASHKVSVGGSTFSGAALGFVVSLVPALAFGLAWKNEPAPALARLGAYIPEPMVVTYNNTVVRRFS